MIISIVSIPEAHSPMPFVADMLIQKTRTYGTSFETGRSADVSSRGHDGPVSVSPSPCFHSGVLTVLTLASVA